MFIPAVRRRQWETKNQSQVEGRGVAPRVYGNLGNKGGELTSRRIDACYSRGLVDVPNYDDKDDLRSHPIQSE